MYCPFYQKYNQNNFCGKINLYLFVLITIFYFFIKRQKDPSSAIHCPKYLQQLALDWGQSQECNPGPQWAARIQARVRPKVSLVGSWSTEPGLRIKSRPAKRG